MSEPDEMRRLFVLFAIGETTTNDGIDFALKASHNLAQSVKNQANEPWWRLWLAGDAASSMPVDDDSDATTAPISKDFKSPYVRKGRKKENPPSGQNANVRQASKEGCLNPRYFVVVDERTEKDESVILCQIDPNNDDRPVLTFRVSAAQSAYTLLGVIVQYNFRDLKEIVDSRKEGESDILW